MSNAQAKLEEEQRQRLLFDTQHEQQFKDVISFFQNDERVNANIENHQNQITQSLEVLPGQNLLMQPNNHVSQIQSQESIRAERIYEEHLQVKRRQHQKDLLKRKNFNVRQKSSSISRPSQHGLLRDNSGQGLSPHMIMPNAYQELSRKIRLKRPRQHSNAMSKQRSELNLNVSMELDGSIDY